MQIIESSVLRIAVSEKGAKLVSLIPQNDQKDFFKDAEEQKALNVSFEGADQKENWAELLPWTIVDKGDSRVSLALIDDAASYKKFPFHFEVILTYAIDGNKVDIKFYLKNNSHKDMPFSVKFTVSLFDDWSIKANANEVEVVKNKSKLAFSSTDFIITKENNEVTAVRSNSILTSDSDENLVLTLTLS